MQPGLTIFANFLIDNEERFLRMKDSYFSFQSVSAQRWVINVRGSFASETRAFLQSQLGSKLVIYKLESKEGWFFDSRIMLTDISGDFVLFWLEDHICLCGGNYLDRVIIEMRSMNVDHLMYSWWMVIRSRYRGVLMSKYDYIDVFVHDLKIHIINKGARNGLSPYIISVTGIFNKSLFEKIILTDNPKEKRWPIETPFDFEKAPQDIHWLPLKVAVPKQELFACIDDDLGFKGIDLQSRGLYPKRLDHRQSYASGHNRGLRRYLNLTIFTNISKIKILFLNFYKNALILADIKSLNILYCLIFNKSGALGSYEWLHNFREKNYVNLDNQISQPSLSFPAIEFLVTRELSKVSVCILGSNDGILWWAERVSEAECWLFDKPLFDYLTHKIQSNARVRFFNVLTENLSLNKVNKFFDIFILDGRSYEQLSHCVLDSLSSSGVIIVNNSDTPACVKLIYMFESSSLKRIDFVGAGPMSSHLITTSVFYRPHNCLHI